MESESLSESSLALGACEKGSSVYVGDGYEKMPGRFGLELLDDTRRLLVGRSEAFSMVGLAF